MQRGITLIEMLVAVTLVALLAAVAAPSVGSGVDTVRLQSTAERMAATLRTGRDRARRSHHYMEVSVDPQTREVALRDLEAGSMSAWEIPPAIEVKSEKRVAFMLYPDGGAQAMRVSFENSRGRRLEVVMDPFTLFPAVKELTR